MLVDFWKEGGGCTHVWQGFHECDGEVLLDIGDPLPQVIVEEILKLASKLDTCGPTANYNHVKKSLNLVWILVFEGGGFAAVHDAFSDPLGIADFFQEQTVFSYTRNT